VVTRNTYKRTGWIVEVGEPTEFTSQAGKVFKNYPIVYQEQTGEEHSIQAIDFKFKNITAPQLSGSQLVELEITASNNPNYPDKIESVVSVADNGVVRPASPAASPAVTVDASGKIDWTPKSESAPSRPKRIDVGPKPDNNSRWLQFNTSLRTAHMQATERVGHLVQLLIAGKLVIKQGDKVEPVTAVTKEILEGWYADLGNLYWAEDGIISREDVFGELHPPQEGVAGNANNNANG